MYVFIMIVHVFVCLILIAVILLQAGRGGGLADVFGGGGGGGAAEKILGTQSNVFMTRFTEVAAVMFVVTSLTLGIMSSQRGKSLLEKGQLLDIVKKRLWRLNRNY